MNRSDGRRLVLRPDAVVRIEGLDRADFTWGTAGPRVTLRGASLRVVEKFAVPQLVEHVVEAFSASAEREVIVAAIERLIDAGVLVDESRAEWETAARVGLFGTPVVSVRSALAGEADVIVVGVPFDGGVTYRPGARFGPQGIRSVSRSVFQAAEPPRGMHDPVRGKRVMESVRVRDVGDILPDPGGGGRRQLDDARVLAGRVAGAGKLLVALGGDHSISAPLIAGVADSVGSIGVLHFDAHHDFSHPASGDMKGLHHGNFLNWSAGDDRVAHIVQCGIRQLTSVDPETLDSHHVWPGRTWVDAGAESLLRTIAADIPWYVTVDVDVIDPAHMPATGTPLPGGVRWGELIDVLVAVLGSRRVVGIDVVEFLPDGHDAPGLEISALLVHAVDAAMGGRR